MCLATTGVCAYPQFDLQLPITGPSAISVHATNDVGLHWKPNIQQGCATVLHLSPTLPLIPGHVSPRVRSLTCSAAGSCPPIGRDVYERLPHIPPIWFLNSIFGRPEMQSSAQKRYLVPDPSPRRRVTELLIAPSTKVLPYLTPCRCPECDSGFLLVRLCSSLTSSKAC